MLEYIKRNPKMNSSAIKSTVETAKKTVESAKKVVSDKAIKTAVDVTKKNVTATYKKIKDNPKTKEVIKTAAIIVVTIALTVLFIKAKQVPTCTNINIYVNKA